MNASAAKLVARLLAIQIGIALFIDFLMTAFAPRLLLLDPKVLGATVSSAAWVALLHVVIASGATVAYARPLAKTLHALAVEEGEVTPEGLLALYALPARVAVAHVVVAVVVSAATLLPPFHPPTTDLYTQVALILLLLTMVSAGALPLYVMMRGAVARVLELAPVDVARRAIQLIAASPLAIPRVRTRFLAAVAGPVAFVALGASLLVYAHGRAFDMSEREAAATDLVHGVLDLVRGSATGRDAAIAEAEAQGFVVEISDTPARREVFRASPVETWLTVPTEDGHAQVRFSTARPSAVTGLYILLSVVAATLAGILGARLGARFSSDVAIATYQVRATGAEDVVRGTRMAQQARFSSVRDLITAIDQLGAIFREFAAAHERATHAREATERMRALFLASMSHDLKAPLNAILGFAAIVSQGELTPGQRESLGIIEQRGRELLGLIQTVLDAARLEAGALEMVREWTVVGDVVMSAVLDARDALVGNGVEIVGEVQPGLPRMNLDATRLVEALTAVIGSAVRFTDQGTVFVRATLPGERLRIDVETTGRGLPAGEQEKLFDTLHPEKARQYGSLGLGLQLARGIVELHGGAIDVDAREGGGLAFRVWLPVPAESVPPPSIRPSSRPLPRT